MSKTKEESYSFSREVEGGVITTTVSINVNDTGLDKYVDRIFDIDRRYRIPEAKEDVKKILEEYSQSQLSEYKEKLKAEIKIALIGIDKTDKHDYNGWWETSSGAEFGENKLIEVLTLIDKI